MQTRRKIKYIFVTGGVVSSLGKGITASSLGLLLKLRGYKVTIQKFDPYINVDAGTMNPFQHGEVFVTEDGAETDLDLGHYERFIDINMTQANNVTTGQIYNEVIKRERRGDFLGETVQVIPHITDEIKNRMKKLSTLEDNEIIITEIGGTVGDIESLPFLEAMRQLMLEVGKKNAISIHVTLVPYIVSAGEVKTKPTQHSVKNLLELGIQPDILVCRSEKKISVELREKIALFCNVQAHSVISAYDCSSIYELPVVLNREKFDQQVMKRLGLAEKKIKLDEWNSFYHRIKSPSGEVEVALVGKYTDHHDSYKSILEAFVHAGAVNDVRVKVRLINSEFCDSNSLPGLLKGVQAVLVPGGFGDRGIEGMIETIHYARIKKIPFFGICLGMQCAVIEFARNVCGMPKAHSSEFSKGKYSVIDYMAEQKNVKNLGGSMRLGTYPCCIQKGTLAYKAYNSDYIFERHRHRYEVNNKFRSILHGKGLVFSGMSPDKELIEMVEIPEHPFFIGCQFHPELKSRAITAHPLFNAFIKAAAKNKTVK